MRTCVYVSTESSLSLSSPYSFAPSLVRAFILFTDPLSSQTPEISFSPFCASLSRAGNDFNAPHRAAVAVIAEGLARLGLVDGPPDLALESGDYQRFYMHPTGHWLGLDVHDVGEYKLGGAWRVLEPGMVTTVEPGLYIGADDTSVKPEYRGIAIRIEDDVLVTRGEPDVLTDAVPKDVASIEALMAGDEAVQLELTP